MKKALVVALAAATAIACSEKSGCMGGAEDACSPQPEPECSVDDDCGEGNFCFGKYCFPIYQCSNDSDCYNNLYCSETLHRCEYLPYCKADSDCTTYGTGLICDSATRYCLHAAVDGDTEAEESSEAASD